MNIQLTGLNIPVTDAITQHVRDRIAAALDQHAGRVHGVQVTLKDLNGPRGGRDMLCAVRVRLQGGVVLAVKRHGHDLYANISLVADKLKNAAGRRLARLKRHRRR